MLVDEEARQEDNTTGVCMEYFLKNGILHYLVSVSEKMDYPEGIRGEGIRTIASMVDLLDDRFLVHNAVHKPTIRLLRFCVLDERQSELDHEDLVDLMYIICSKIHGFPALLNIFFHDKQWLTTPQKTNSTFTGNGKSNIPTPLTSLTPIATTQNAQPEYEFLLFTYLLRYVHLEGRSGDFARTGLLFLMEMATGQLGDFILESDFATIMVAGLGALYSQLPRKLIIKDDAEVNSSPASFLLGQDLDPRAFPSEELGVEQSNSEQFKYQLDSFLKPLEFCQDILLHCPNDAISERLLQCIRKIFLENILNTSILECSDTDGSSVAVISYIDLILQTMQQQDLADVIVGFLMDVSSDEQEEEDFSSMKSPISPGSGMNVFGGGFTTTTSSTYVTSGRYYTLKDLIFNNLKSKSQPTVIATLKLVRTLITKHCRFASRLLSTVPEKSTMTAADYPSYFGETSLPPTTIISHHIREIELYFALVSAIDQVHADDILTLGYEDYLRDMGISMNNDACFQQSMIRPTIQHQQQHQQFKNSHHHTTTASTTPKSQKRRSFKYGQKRRSSAGLVEAEEQENNKRRNLRTIPCQQRHRIRSTDKLIQTLLGLLSNFFAQSSELNLALTGVISALAICPYRSLEGWIAFCESDRTNADDVLNLSSSSVTTNMPTVHEEGQGGEATTAIRASEIYALTAIQEQEKKQGQDDDQSVDFGVERNSIHMTAPTQFKSFPPFYTLLRTLTQQINYYRNEIDGFDTLLYERWNGLLFSGGTSNAVASGGGGVYFSGTPVPSSSSSIRRGSIFDQQPLITSPSNTSTNSVTSKLFGLGGGSNNNSSNNNNGETLKRRNSLSLLKASNSSSTSNVIMPPNPSKSLSSSTTAAAMAVANGTMPTSTSTTTASNSLNQGNNSSSVIAATTPIIASTPTATKKSIPMIPVINPLSPLALHAKKTLQVRIQPLFPSNFEIDRDLEPILDLNEEDEDMFAPRSNPSQRKKMDKSTEISLSMLLNNVVILEEMIKELVAIMQVRRSLGVDKIRYT